jgi:uncharacterized protein YecA (UPF0149 family)
MDSQSPGILSREIAEDKVKQAQSAKIRAIMDKRRAAEALRNRPKVGRNAPCPCNSGKKYKKCCLDKPVDPGERVVG